MIGWGRRRDISECSFVPLSSFLCFPPCRVLFGLGWSRRLRALVWALGWERRQCADLVFAGGGNRYLILDVLGQGTFGQVVKCQDMKTHDVVAVKVVKNKPAYFNQSMMEVTILEMVSCCVSAPSSPERITSTLSPAAFR